MEGSALQGFLLTVGADLFRLIAENMDVYCRAFTTFAHCG